MLVEQTWAYDFQSGDLYYNITNNAEPYTVEVTYQVQQHHNFDLTTVTIPEKVTYNGIEYAVTAIGDEAFYFCGSLASVTIPNSVTSIGDRAFCACRSLASITIPNSVSCIGESAFSYCDRLTSITIPNSITSIGDGAFGSCSNLASVTIPNSVLSIGNYAFSSCSSLASVTISNGVTSIGDGAFGGCSSLASITIPNSITSIGDGAFGSCSNLASVTIPNSVTNIGKQAFEYCNSLASVNIPNSVTSIGERAFQSCTSVNIPNSVTSIGNEAFVNVKNIVYNGTDEGRPWGALTINGVIDGDFVFADTEKKQLTAYVGKGGSITIPNSVTCIGYRAFSECHSLVTVTIPNSVTNISDEAFTYVKNIVYNGTAEGKPWGALTINGVIDGDFIFADAEKKQLTAYVGEGGSVTIPNSVTSIGSLAFYECNNLASVTIPNSVTRIGDGVFYNCSNLASVTIPNSVTRIGDGAFSNCSSLQYNEYDNALYLGNSDNPYLCLIKTKSSNITSCEINSSCKCIYNEAFSYCSSLTTIEIPNSVTNIGFKAFYHCDQLQYNEYNNCCYLGNDDNPYLCLIKTKSSNITSCEINSNCKIIYGGGYPWDWSGLQSLTSVVIPNSVTSIGDFAFCYCSGLASVTIPNSVTSIGCSAFCYCSGLASVTIPNSVTCIGDWAFAYVKNIDYNGSAGGRPWGALTINAINGVIDGDFVFADADKKQLTAYVGNESSITIPNSVTSIGYRAFSNCSNLASVTIPNSVTRIGDGAFSNCSSLTSVTIPNSIKSIGNHAFSNCRSLASIEIPNSVSSISDRAFIGCSNLTLQCVAKQKPEEWITYWNYDNRPVVWGGATAISEFAADKDNLLVYAYGNTIVVENATEGISVYNAMGALVCRDAIHRVRTEINVRTAGIYIVRVGNTVKRVMVND